MKFSMTVFFSLLFILVLGVYLYLEPAKKPAAPMMQPPERLINLSDGDELVSIQINRPKEGTAVILQKEGNEWMLKEPVRYQADALRVKGMVSALTLGNKIKTFKPEDGWTAYGLENPDLKVTIATRKQPEGRTLLFGKEAPLGRSIYAQWEGEPVLFLLDPRMKKIFESSSYAFREKRVFHALLKDVKEIKIETPVQIYEVVKNGEAWLWVEPITLLGEEMQTDSINQLLAYVQNFFIKDFLASDGADNDFGFGELGTGVSVHIQTDTETQILDIGNEIPEKDVFCARMRGDDTVFGISRTRILELFETIHQLALKVKEAKEPERIDLDTFLEQEGV